ncbi:carcinoembryonic antigen-related cell adhesion molecule 21-like [Pteronotus mesoamericanus]|uniref:carcinoembryonic antigen-related cell adhesion molecule 21-like n=1 Tax=Pteronotus mesoamericanus TaxID=1884717 RepID=UPI0023ED6343|nr:carcinoembryonic antigen-related cell adhesion molecule 21-like [Pteronotus parnellii mesoamericanus]
MGKTWCQRGFCVTNRNNRHFEDTGGSPCGADRPKTKTQQRPCCRRCMSSQGHMCTHCSCPPEALSLLNFWNPPTTAQLAIVSTNAAEGEEVLLHIRNKPPDVIAFVWYRGEGANKNRVIALLAIKLNLHLRGPAHSGQERINNDGSLLLKEVTKRDTGMYTIVVYLEDSKKEIGFGRLNVYEPVRVPALLANNTTVTENKDAVVLTCYTNAISTHWLFNGMNLQFTDRMKLSQDHRSLTIDPFKREDAGYYQCEVSNPISFVKSAPLELDVKSE